MFQEACAPGPQPSRSDDPRWHSRPVGTDVPSPGPVRWALPLGDAPVTSAEGLQIQTVCVPTQFCVVQSEGGCRGNGHGAGPGRPPTSSRPLVCSLACGSGTPPRGAEAVRGDISCPLGNRADPRVPAGVRPGGEGPGSEPRGRMGLGTQGGLGASLQWSRPMSPWGSVNSRMGLRVDFPVKNHRQRACARVCACVRACVCVRSCVCVRACVW